MRWMRSITIGLLALTASGLAKAEYGCQSGFVPVYQGNRQVCVADYNLPVWKQQGGGQQDQQPAEIWEDRYGAVAKIPGTAKYFVSVELPSKRQADKDVLRKCGSGCEITSRFRNSCIAVAWSGETNFFMGGEGQSEAEKNVIDACDKKSNSCELLFSACSLPVRVQ